MQRLTFLLQYYPKRCDAIELAEGFNNGFKLNYTGPRYHTIAPNLISANMHKEETMAKLMKEVSLGRMLGPFKILPISTLRISPIGLVPKSDGSWRLITHLSYPPECSVNSFIDEKFCKVQYTSFDSILDKIFELGPKALLGKIDVKSAFRLLIIHPADFDLLGIHFQGMYFVEKNLPMGLSLSCSLWEKFAHFLQWLVKVRSGLSTIDHYLDDYICMGAQHSLDCATLMSTLTKVCSELKIPLADEKTIGPTTVLPFLGFIIDTELQLVLIPKEKLVKLHALLMPILSKRKMLVKDLESVTGLLSYCSRAIPAVRAFIRRFYDLTASIKHKKPYYRVKINQEIKSDVQMLLYFLDKFNGHCYFPERLWLTSDFLQLFTDASGNPELGCGSYFQGHWAHFTWPIGIKNSPLIRNLAYLEMVPVLLAVYLWGNLLKNKRIILQIDNLALVSILNKSSSKDKNIMILVRQFVLMSMMYNIHFKAVHIESSENKLADALSRFQMEKFRLLAPSADSVPTAIPEEFWQNLVH